MLSLILANFILLWHMVMYKQRTIKMKITQMNDKVIITYMNFKRKVVSTHLNRTCLQKQKKKSLIALTLTT